MLPLATDTARVAAMAAAAASVGQRGADEALADLVHEAFAAGSGRGAVRAVGPGAHRDPARHPLRLHRAVPPAGDLGRVHFVAIGGAGMSGVARVMLTSGVPVSGSDARESPVLTALEHEGAQVWVGHDASHVDGADTVVVSSAVRDGNVELAAARERGLRVLHRAQGLAATMVGARARSRSPGPTARRRRPRCSSSPSRPAASTRPSPSAAS